MKKIAYLFYRPDLFFRDMAKRKFLGLGMVIWSINAIGTVIIYSLKNYLKYYFIDDFSQFDNIKNLLLSIIFSLFIVFFISIITNIIAKQFKAKSNLIKLIVAHLFIYIISISFIPIQIISILLRSAVIFKISIILSGIWQFYLSFIALKTIYNFSIKKTVLVGVISWFIVLFISVIIIFSATFFSSSMQVNTYTNEIQSDSLICSIPVEDYLLRNGDSVKLKLNIRAEIIDKNLYIQNVYDKEMGCNRIADYIYGFLLFETSSLNSSELTDNKLEEISLVILNKCNEHLNKLGIKITKLEIVQ